VMDRMIRGRGRGHEPSRRINHVRGIINYLPPISPGPTRRGGTAGTGLPFGGC
jgi:hypothetical protein